MQQNTIVDKELENLQVNQVSLNLFICTFPNLCLRKKNVSKLRNSLFASSSYIGDVDTQNFFMAVAIKHFFGQ